MTDPKDLKIEFAPGCFDGFEGSQAELDELIAEITKLAESGELFAKSKPVNIDDLSEDELLAFAVAMGIDPETGEDVDVKSNRTLQ